MGKQEISYKLEHFEGPLDLLLHLRKYACLRVYVRKTAHGAAECVLQLRVILRPLLLVGKNVVRLVDIGEFPRDFIVAGVHVRVIPLG